MNRRKWKDLAEAIGFTAIIASLVFVGIETRNSTKQSELNTQALEISAYQALMANIDEINMLSLESPQAAATMTKIWASEPEDAEQFQMNRMLYILFRHGDLAYFMYERGAIDKDRLDSALAPLPIGTKVAKDFWAIRKNAFTEGFRNHVDQLMANSSTNAADNRK